MTTSEIHRGLAGVVVDTTAIFMVNQDTNSLTDRGYPVQDLRGVAPAAIPSCDNEHHPPQEVAVGCAYGDIRCHIVRIHYATAATDRPGVHSLADDDLELARTFPTVN